MEWTLIPAGARQTDRQKLGLVWRNRMKNSQIIKDYFYLPFFLLIILWILYFMNRERFLSLYGNRKL
jgi:hypothetical protein